MKNVAKILLLIVFFPVLFFTAPLAAVFGCDCLKRDF